MTPNRASDVTMVSSESGPSLCVRGHFPSATKCSNEGENATWEGPRRSNFNGKYCEKLQLEGEQAGLGVVPIGTNIP